MLTRSRGVLVRFESKLFSLVACAAVMFVSGHEWVRAEQPPTQMAKPRSSPVLPAERRLITHPSHLKWWVLPNMEKHPDQPRLITGVFCLCVENKSGGDSVKWLGEVHRRSKRLGLEFVYGIRHSHQSFEAFDQPLDPSWQKRVVNKLNAIGAPSIVLDMEPY